MPNTTNKPTGGDANGWTEYRRLVLAELERLSRELQQIQSQIASLQLVLSQSINDNKHTTSEKIREATNKLDDTYEKRCKETGTETEKSLKELERKLEKADETIEKVAKDLHGLNSKAMALGAAAGFIMSLVGLMASIFFKK